MWIAESSLVVSVQAERHEPLAPLPVIEALCQSVLQGGAQGLRLADLALIKKLRHQYSDLPIIGLTKPEPLPERPETLVYITPTSQDALALLSAGANVIATDATLRPRYNKETLGDWVNAVRKANSSVELMADCSCLKDALNAHHLGFDYLSTTLSGYTQATREKVESGEPDFELLSSIHQSLPSAKLILEGRIWQPEQVKRAFDLGAYAIVVGSAITRPHHITRRFLQAIDS